MAQSIQLSELISRIRGRYEVYADQVSDDTLTDWINEANSKLRGMLLRSNAAWSLSEDTQNLVSGQRSYNLPADCWRVLRVDVLRSGSNWVTLEPYMLSEETSLDHGNVTDRSFYRYCVAGSTIRIAPLPTEGITSGLRVLYNPNTTQLTTGTDTVDGVAGFENYIILEVGIRAFHRLDWDVQALLVERREMEDYIKSLANSPDRGNPKRIRDAYAEFYHRHPYIRSSN